MPLTERTSREIVSEVYEDVKDLVKDISVRFAKHYRTDPDETFCWANYFFLEAYHGYDETMGTSLEQRIQSIIWNRLFDQYRKDTRIRTKDKIRMVQWRKRKEYTTDALAFEDTPPFESRDILREVGEDAKTVLTLVLETPAELLEAIRGAEKPGTKTTRGLVSRYLTESLGWTLIQVRKTFRELKEALS